MSRNKFNRNKVFLLIVGLILIQSFNISVVYSQQKKLKFEYLTTEEGLSQPTAKCILQDKQGFLWIGTKNGLNRYDGYKIKRYYSSIKDSTSIAGSSIHYIYEDSKGNLWFPNSGGLSLYNRDFDNFINFRNIANDTTSLLTNTASTIFEDSKGRLWVGDFSSGLNYFDFNKKNFTHFLHSEANPKSISSNNVRAIREAPNGNLIIATDGGGINIFDPEKKTFIHYIHKDNDPKSLPVNIVWNIVKDKNGNFWLGTLGAGICKMNFEKNGSVTFETFKAETSDERRHKILSLINDTEGNGLWIGTENGGLDYFEFATKKFYNYSYDEDSPNSLNNNSIQSLYIDKTGNLWVGTFTGGLNVWKKHSKKIDTYRRVPGNPNSLSYNAVSCFLQNNDGTIYIGTDGGGLNIFDRNKACFKHLDSKNSNLKSDAILSIDEDSFNNIWVSGWESGLNIFDKSTNSFRLISKDEANVSNHKVYATFVDKKGRLWISFGGIGLSRFNYKNQKFETLTPKNSKLPSEWIFDIKEDKLGNLLLGHIGGLCFFNPDNGVFKNYVNNLNDTSSLSDSHVNIILVSNNNTIWIGTVNGLNKFNAATENFTHYTEIQGLTNSRITGLIEDKKGFIWVSTDNGISKLDPRTNKIKNYSASDGFQGKTFTRRACYFNKLGEIFLGGNNGFNIFNPDSLKDNPILPNVLITDFQIFNKPVEIGKANSPLVKSIFQSDELHLSYKYSVFTFEFAAIDFTSPNQNQYAYKLEGFDKEWNYTGNNRLATYTNIDPGTYYLKVFASNNDKVWSKNITTLKIVIEPPFWKTIWFKIMVILLIIIIILLYIRNRINRFRKQNILLERKVRERTLELEETNLLLEEKQEEINLQKEELTTQRDALATNNQLLVAQKEQIIEQNQELDLHRYQLELLVEERTKELEKALYKAEESDRLKSSFLANMSHEIRTPMNAIIGFTELLGEKNISDKEREDYINIVTKSGKSLMVIINDILDLSLIQADQMLLNPLPVVLVNVLNEIYESFLLETNRKNIQLILKHDLITPDYLLKTDYIRLKQVFNNLISNALKFTPEGSIEFGIYKFDEELTFYVKDTGIGIQESTGNTIFERFLKVENNKKTLYGGTGLGLAICKSLVELWGGKISYNSEFDKGTTFYFTHPCYKVNKTRETKFINKNIEMIPDLKNKNILIAEDEENNYKLISVYLKKTEANVIWVFNGKEAVEYALGNHIDLILMDIKMPIMNGLDATEIIKKQYPNLPILAQTAFAYDYELNEFKKSGIDEYLVKPINRTELYNLLKKYLLKE